MQPHKYGELPPHPIEAKFGQAIPEGGHVVAVIGERELYETTPSNKTKAQQYDEMYGSDNWAVRRNDMKMPDGSDTQLIDVYASEAQQVTDEAAQRNMGSSALENL